MSDPTPAEYVHELGGRLPVALANTVLWRRSDEPVELLGGYGDLVRFGQRAGLLDAAAAERLRATAARRPAQAEQVLAQARGLRDALYALFNDLAGGREPDAGALATVNAAAADALAASALEPAAQGGFRRRFDTPDHGLDAVLREVAAAAQELLLSPAELARLKQCPGPQCGWLFVDDTRNRSRRWCDTHLCGNRDRVRRHAERHRQSS